MAEGGGVTETVPGGPRPSRGGGGRRDGVAVLGGAVVVGSDTVAGGWRCSGGVGGSVTEGWSRRGSLG